MVFQLLGMTQEIRRTFDTFFSGETNENVCPFCSARKVRNTILRIFQQTSTSNRRGQLLKSKSLPSLSLMDMSIVDTSLIFPQSLKGISPDCEYLTNSKGFPVSRKWARRFERFPLKRFDSLATRLQCMK